MIFHEYLLDSVDNKSLMWPLYKFNTDSINILSFKYVYLLQHRWLFFLFFTDPSHFDIIMIKNILVGDNFICDTLFFSKNIELGINSLIGLCLTLCNLLIG